MRILIQSRPFSPSVGGLEMVMEMLAEGFVREGHEVKVVTETSDEGGRRFPFEVVRNPRSRELLSLVIWSDVVLQGGLSLKWLWPLLLIRRRLVVSHHIWLTYDLRGRIKNLLTTLLTNIAVSEAVASHIMGGAIVIPNGYRNDIFRETSGKNKEQELVFLGRLVRDKGVDVLLNALAILSHGGLRPSLTVIGSGPEQDRLRMRVAELGLSGHVTYIGVRRGEDLARTLSGHRILVVPSTWEEPFGIVALEGIACGCVVIGTDGGGLPEAIGACGVVVPRCNDEALAAAIRELLTNEELYQRCCAASRDHLARYAPDRFIRAYLDVLAGWKAAADPVCGNGEDVARVRPDPRIDNVAHERCINA